MDGAGLVVALMIGIPLAGIALFLLLFLVLGRRMRTLRRQGRVTYPARTTPGSDLSSSSTGGGA